MAEIQEFCLKWNNYQSNLASAFLDLKRGEDFVDVTLACDGRSVQAHRVVLSACSPFFRDLLKATPCKHPIVVLKDVSFGDLVALIEFMYQGEVKVGQDGLSSFLRTAEVLRIKGLTEEPSTQKRPRQDAEHAVSPTYRGKSWLKVDRPISTPPPSLSQPVMSHSFTGLPPPSMSIVPQPQVSTQQSNDFVVEKQLRLSSSIAVTKKLRLIPSAAVPEPVELSQPPSAASPSNWHPERDTSVISHNPNHFNTITVRSKAEMIELETSSGSDCIEKEEDEDRNYPTPQLHVHMPSSLGEPPEDSFRMLPNESQPEVNGAMDVGTSLPLNRIPELSHMLGPYQGSAEPISTEKNSGRTVTHQRPRWQCPFCSRLLSSRSSVRRHVEDRHTTDGSRQQCPICERQYRTRNSLQFHLSTAHRDRDPSLRMRRRFRNAMAASVSALTVPEFKDLPPPVPLTPQKLAETVVHPDEETSVIVKVEEQPRIVSFHANATL